MNVHVFFQSSYHRLALSYRVIFYYVLIVKDNVPSAHEVF